MYIESGPNRNSPPAVLLRESYRDGDGKVKKRTVANLSRLKPEVIEGLRVLLKGGHASGKPLEEQFKVERTLPHGHVAAALGLFGKLGMSPLLERKRSEERSLAAALIVSRLLDPGSKLALSRQLSRETATSTLGERLAVCMNPALREERALDSLCVYGFNTLLSELATLCRVTIRPDIKNADAFFKLTEPTGYVPPSLRGIPGPLRCTR